MSTNNRNTLFSGGLTGFSDPLYPSTDTGGTIRMGVLLTSTGTIAWQHTMDGTNWYAIAAYNESAQTLATTASASGIYTINASGSFAVRANITANGSGVVITGTVVKGGGGGGAGSSGGGGGGGGGAVTVADGADTSQGATTDAPAASPTTAAAATEIALLKQIANNTSAATSNAVVPTTTVDPTNTFTQPTMDAASRSGYTVTQGLTADGASASGVSSISIGSPDSGGLMRTPQTNLASVTPVTTSTYGIQTNSVMFGNSSANTLRPLLTATGFGTGGSASGVLMAAEARAAAANAGSYEPVFNNLNTSILASGARTTTQTSADQTNPNHKGIKIVLDVTSGSGLSLVLTLDDKDLNSSKFSNVLTSAAITGVSTTVFRVYPTATAVTNLTVNDIIARIFRIVVTAGNATSATYSVSYSLLV